MGEKRSSISTVGADAGSGCKGPKAPASEEQQGTSVAGLLEVGGSLKSSLGGRAKAALGFCSR